MIDQNTLGRNMAQNDALTPPDPAAPDIINRLRAAPDFLPASRVYVQLPRPVDILLLSETTSFDLIDRRINFTLVENVAFEASDFLDQLGGDITTLNVIAEDRQGRQVRRWFGNGLFMIDRKFERQWIFEDGKSPAQVWTVTVGCNRLKPAPISDPGPVLNG